MHYTALGGPSPGLSSSSEKGLESDLSSVAVVAVLCAMSVQNFCWQWWQMHNLLQNTI